MSSQPEPPRLQPGKGTSMGKERAAKICLPAVLALALACRTAGTPPAVAPAAAPAAPVAPAAAAARSPAEGLWEGLLVYKPGELEVEIAVEIAARPDGGLVGTIDVPNQHIKFHPLENVSAEGSRVSFMFTRVSEERGTVVSPFTATVSADGSTMSGEFLEGGKNRVPFTLVRTGDAGSDRRELPLGTLHLLSAGGEELKAAFNRDQGKVRLVMLLSPT
jgi:hypothetical protein